MVAKKKTINVSKDTLSKKRRVRDDSLNIVPVTYMFLLLVGLALVFVALVLKILNYIDSSIMVTCLGISLIFMAISAFIKNG